VIQPVGKNNLCRLGRCKKILFVNIHQVNFQTSLTFFSIVEDTMMSAMNGIVKVFIHKVRHLNKLEA